MLIRLLPLITGLLPIVAILASFFIAVDAGRVPACNPFIDGCTSISATGRYPPASYLFRAAMLPQSVLLAIFWLFSAAWLRSLVHAAGRTDRREGRIIGVLGVGGALCLILYVTFLGTTEPFYEFMRRFGVYLYFLMTVLAQLGVALRVRPLAVTLANGRLRLLANCQLGLAIVPFLMGILNLVLKAVLANPDPAENVIEWFFALLMQAWFLLAWMTWRSTGFNASFSSSDPSGRGR